MASHSASRSPRPDTDRFNFSDRELRAKIKVALGGRCAEEIVFGDLTTGAESDFQQLTQIARQMVGRWGMSEKIGTITVLRQEGWPSPPEISEETQRLIDEEVRTLVSAAHEEVLQLLGAHRDRLDRLAQALLEHETLDQDDAYAAAGIEPPPADLAGELAVAARAAQPTGASDTG